jgi:hypothetical protein
MEAVLHLEADSRGSIEVLKVQCSAKQAGQDTIQNNRLVLIGLSNMFRNVQFGKAYLTTGHSCKRDNTFIELSTKTNFRT